MELFLTKGADINAIDANGDSPLDVALKKSNEEIARLLIDNTNLKISNVDLTVAACLARNGN